MTDRSNPDDLEQSGAGQGVTLSPNLTRRRLLRSSAVAGTAVASGAIGSRYAVRDARGALPLVPLAIIGAGLVGGALASELGWKSYEDLDQQEDDWDAWNAAYRNAREGQIEQESVFESYEQDAYHAANLGRRDAAFRIYEVAATGGSEQDALDAAKSAIDDHFSRMEKRLWSYYTSQTTRFEQDNKFFFGDAFSKNGELVLALERADPENDSLDAPWQYDYSGSLSDYSYDLRAITLDPTDVTLPNGEVVSVPEHDTIYPDDTSHGSRTSVHWGARPGSRADVYDGTWSVDDNQTLHRIGMPWVRPPDDSQFSDLSSDASYDGPKLGVDFAKFHELFKLYEDERKATRGEAQTMVDNWYEPAKAGEVDLTEMVGAQGLLDAASEADSFREASLVFRTFGFPTSQPVEVEFETEEGEYVTTSAQLAWNTAQEGDTIPIGDPVDPALLPGTFYIAYNREQSDGTLTGDVGRLDDTFTVVSTENTPEVEGELSFDQQGVVEASDDPADVEEEMRDSGQAARDAKEAEPTVNINASLIPKGFLSGKSLTDVPLELAAAVVIGSIATLVGVGAALKALAKVYLP